jgi:hypothetical protein
LTFLGLDFSANLDRMEHMKKIIVTAEVRILQVREYEIDVPDDFPEDIGEITEGQLDFLTLQTDEAEEYVANEDVEDMEIVEFSVIV